MQVAIKEVEGLLAHSCSYLQFSLWGGAPGSSQGLQKGSPLK